MKKFVQIRFFFISSANSELVINRKNSNVFEISIEIERVSNASVMSISSEIIKFIAIDSSRFIGDNLKKKLLLKDFAFIICFDFFAFSKNHSFDEISFKITNAIFIQKISKVFILRNHVVEQIT